MSMSVRGAVICSCSPHTRMSTSADRTLHCAPPPATLQNTPQVLRTFLMVTFHQAPLHSSAPPRVTICVLRMWRHLLPCISQPSGGLVMMSRVPGTCTYYFMTLNKSS